MTFEALLPWIIGLAVIYVPMIIFIGYELWRAPLVDDDGNIISEPKVRTKTAQERRQASLTPAE